MPNQLPNGKSNQAGMKDWSRKTEIDQVWIQNETSGWLQNWSIPSDSFCLPFQSWNRISLRSGATFLHRIQMLWLETDQYLIRNFRLASDADHEYRISIRFWWEFRISARYWSEISSQHQILIRNFGSASNPDQKFWISSRSWSQLPDQHQILIRTVWSRNPDQCRI